MSKLKVSTFEIEGLKLIEPNLFCDNRGYFFESYNEDEFKKIGICEKFVQDNESKSKKGVLRGLHYQVNKPQGKLVRVVLGSVLDVVVDLRCNSSTYGKWESVTLSDANKKMLYIPPGFAHGFLVLSEEAVFAYKCTELYDPNSEEGIRYDDPTLDINWPTCLLDRIVVSEKDRKLKEFKKIISPFNF